MSRTHLNRALGGVFLGVAFLSVFIPMAAAAGNGTIFYMTGFGPHYEYFGASTHYIGTPSAILPHELAWEGNNITVVFGMEGASSWGHDAELRFFCPFKNYGNNPDPILRVSIGPSPENMTVVVDNYTVVLGENVMPFNASFISEGTNYLQVYGKNIYPIGAGNTPPNFQWRWLNLSWDAETVLPPLTDDELLDMTEGLSARYSFDQSMSSPTYFVRDVSAAGHSSIAATGFGLTAYTIMAERYGTSSYWTVTPTQARGQTSAILDQLLYIQDRMTDYPPGYGKEGLFYHFMEMIGFRAGSSEVSTVDNAILASGIITAGEYFGGDIKEKGDLILSRMNWTYFFDEEKMQFSHGWTPEGGLMAQTWDRPSDETMLISFIALAQDPANEDYRDSFYSWPRVERSYGGYTVVNSYFGSAFTYFFAHAWLDFEKLGKDKPPAGSGVQAVDWWENSVNATLAGRQFAIDNAWNYTFYGNDSWGLTPCQKATGAYEGRYGAAPSEYNAGVPYHDGTICPYGSISAMPFFDAGLDSNPSFASLRHYYENYYHQLWGPYGPSDSFGPYGFSRTYLGIDVGPQVLMIENYRTGFVWETFMKNENVTKARCVIFTGQEWSPADANGDGKVGIMDLVIVGKGFGKVPGDAGWDERADTNGDGRVSIIDLSTVGKHYGKNDKSC